VRHLRNPPRSAGLLLAIAIAFLALFSSHYPLLGLPFYWDEIGQFVPAALDIYHRLAWVPYTTVPNVHPPGVMAYLALVWSLFGYSIWNTRVALLAIAACGLVLEWKLARILTGRRGPALLATMLLFCCPLFFSQSEMAQLDMPAMVLTAASLVLFFEERMRLCALACCAAVMTKETALLAPALFGFVLLRRKRTRDALFFLLPLLPLLAWLMLLRQSTGHWFGSPAFAAYNLSYPLHPVRLALALLRRAYYLLAGSGHIIGTLAVLYWWKKTKPVDPRWSVAVAFVGLHAVLVSVLGGAVLERYLLPALPILYAAFAGALWTLTPRLRTTAALALIFCLLLACVFNPPYPFPFENNLAWTTFVTLQKQAAEYSEAVLAKSTVATSFPMTDALRRPEMGYVSAPMHVLELDDFRPSTLSEKVRGHAGALIQFSSTWDPLHTLNTRAWSQLLQRFYGYGASASAAETPQLTGMRSALRECAAGQCIEVFRAPQARLAATSTASLDRSIRQPGGMNTVAP
jgi:4-amino-4-deoxy-L-arabinose transferase-like glycosyltransferase